MSARVKRERGVAPKIENGSGSELGMGPSQGIEVKTKFPVARIKRIMQADEEVGKVAQVTPVAVCKFSHSYPRYSCKPAPVPIYIYIYMHIHYSPTCLSIYLSIPIHEKPRN
jgi:hypothetical protein